MPVIKAAQPAAAEDIDDKQLGKMAEKAVRWKLRGDRALVQTYVIHLFYVLGALIFVARYPSSPPEWKSVQMPHAIELTHWLISTQLEQESPQWPDVDARVPRHEPVGVHGRLCSV